MKSSFLLIGGMMMAAALGSCGGSSGGDKSEADTTTSDTLITPAAATPAPEGTLIASANLMSTADSTQSLGTARFYKLDSTQIRLDVVIDDKARADSNVAVHFHEHGDCGNKGDNTHGHWNPTKQQHGEWGSVSYHLGDIGNILLDANGHGTKSVTTDKWSIDSKADNDILGKGIIVHGGTDDYKTQPTGNSGPRIGCGVIVKE
ncbi:MAG: superoxide dismutase family protein [Niabella sp.]